MAATATLLTRSIQGESLSAATDRLVNAILLVEGVVNVAGNSFQVLQNLGTDMNVKIGSGTANDKAVVKGDLAGQGTFLPQHQNATQVLAVAASDPTLDRIDLVILKVYDDTFDSSGNDYADLEVITGTPDASPVAPALPSTAISLAEILVQNAVTQIVNGDITDKRNEVLTKGQLFKTIIYTANDTFTKADHVGLQKIRVRLVSGGGGGGGAAAGIGSNQAASASGGGGGGYAEEEILESALGATETVTVGGGGAGGAAGVNNGVAGSSSSFGSLLSATGGGFGVGDNATNVWGMQVGGAGGIGPDGDLTLDGEPGSNGTHDTDAVNQLGSGGSSQLGEPGRYAGDLDDSVGPAGTGHGSGGGGAYAKDPSGVDRAGGAGAAGIVIVDLYA